MNTAAVTNDILDLFGSLAKGFAQKPGRRSFNIFSTLLPTHDEVRLHTRFIHSLLDPNGTHGCGPEFLNLFFLTLAERPGLNHADETVAFAIPTTAAGWHVEKEVSCGEWGRIDLLCESLGCGLAIENKIHAYEQPQQLARYAGYLCSRDYSSKWVIIYLTLHGKRSDTHAGTRYLRISYTTHILEWIERCVEATKHIPSLNPIICQYREIVRQLTGTAEPESMKTAVTYIEKNPEIVRFRQQLVQAIEETRAVFYDGLAAGLEKDLLRDYEVRRRVNGRFGKDPDAALRLMMPASSPLHSFEIWIKHIARFENALMIGIESKFGKQPLSIEQQRRMDLANGFLREQTALERWVKANPQALLWDDTHWPVGWINLIHPLNDETLAKLLASGLKKAVSEYAAKIRKSIKLMEDAYAKTKGLVSDQV